MPMVSSKLGIGAIEGRVAVGFWLLDPVESANVSLIPFHEHFPVEMRFQNPHEKEEGRGIVPIAVCFGALVMLRRVL